MTISQSAMKQVRSLIRPIQTKVSNLVARALIKGISDAGTRQTAQVAGLPTETLDDVQHFISYGLISVPRAGAEGVMLFVDGDRGHPMIVSVDDRASRPTDGDPGDTGLYHFEGAQIRLNKDGDIVISAKAGGKVLVDDGSGTTRPLALLRDVDNLKKWVEAQFSATAGHKHAVVGAATTAIITVPAPAASPPDPSVPQPIIGTTVLEGK